MPPRSTPAPALAGNLPDSARAWVVAGAAFVSGFVVFGVIYGFGVLIVPMTADLDAGTAGASALFSAAGLAFYMIGPIAGHLGDRFGPRIMVAFGAALLSLGLVTTALIDRLWIGYLTYGLLVGLGAAFAYLPTLAIVGGWFERHRATALGVAAAGTGCGMMVLPPLTAGLIERIGWRASVVAVGIVCGILLAGCAVAVRAPPAQPAGAAKALIRSLLSPAFVMMYLSWVLATIALFVAFIFLPPFAVDLGASQTAASALLSVIGAMSIMGRLGIGMVSDRLGIGGLFKTAVFVMAVSYVVWLLSTTYQGLLLFAMILGLGYGVRIALVPGMLIALFGLRNLGTMLGVFFTATGVASVLGPIAAGVIVDLSGGYEWGIVFALAMAGIGFLAILPVRIGPRD
jgi:MFS family permease